MHVIKNKIGRISRINV